LIERFYDPCEGKILFNGVDIRNLDGEIYHQQVGIVQQEPILFAGTVADNIIFGMDLDHLSDDEVRAMIDEACKMAFCYDFIHDKALFPDGYDTICGERGVKLSGGQKQRIAIARALLKNPPIKGKLFYTLNLYLFKVRMCRIDQQYKKKTGHKQTWLLKIFLHVLLP
jgi:ATP-binding cassette subfamily B (MDR/TAP) protein 1